MVPDMGPPESEVAYDGVANDDIVAATSSPFADVTRRELEMAVWRVHRFLTATKHPDASSGNLANALTFLVTRRVLLDPTRARTKTSGAHVDSDEEEEEDSELAQLGDRLDAVTAECVRLLDDSRAG